MDFLGALRANLKVPFLSPPLRLGVLGCSKHLHCLIQGEVQLGGMIVTLIILMCKKWVVKSENWGELWEK